MALFFCCGRCRGFFLLPDRGPVLHQRYIQLYITLVMAAINKKSKARAPSYRLAGRLWIEGRDGTFLGYGRVVLLERIGEHGSISAAARSMSMSYRHAWKLIDSINGQAAEPLVEMSTGGTGGGGAKLTGAGKQAIEIFWSAHAEFKAFLEQQTAGLEW
jgi:molybdate transport system regulatory protein